MWMSVDVEQRTRERAYAIWLEEGCPEGCDAEHWARAEAEIRAETPVAELVAAPVTVTPAKAPRKPRGAAKMPVELGSTIDPLAEASVMAATAKPAPVKATSAKTTPVKSAAGKTAAKKTARKEEAATEMPAAVRKPRARKTVPA
jgi:hypothetical protein